MWGQLTTASYLQQLKLLRQLGGLGVQLSVLGILGFAMLNFLQLPGQFVDRPDLGLSDLCAERDKLELGKGLKVVLRVDRL